MARGLQPGFAGAGAYGDGRRDVGAAGGGAVRRRRVDGDRLGAAGAVNGERTARRQGQPRRSKLDAHAAFLRELVARTCDITLNEMQARLREERGVSAGIGTLSRFFGRQDYSWKKNRSRRRAGSAGRLGRA